MINMLERAILKATILYQGKKRAFQGVPFILHPIEVAEILSTMTKDQEVLTAGILHDIVTEAGIPLQEIERQFGKRVALLVQSKTEGSTPYEERGADWKEHKREQLLLLKNSEDIGIKMLWLADKLANIRSLARIYTEKGDAIWPELHQTDPELHRWYYKSVAESLELSLNRTGAFKELIQHINFLWPGTFSSEKARYRKYREISLEGCRLIGRGAKGNVYQVDDEVVVKVFNEKNTYSDVEREIALSRRAFVLGIPTAISFGIFSVGNQYGAMYELMSSEPVSGLIAKSPRTVDGCAKIMAELAHTIHSTKVTEADGFPSVSDRLLEYIANGIELEDESLAEKCRKLVSTLFDADTLIHGDFHTGNVFLQKGEPFLIDMDRIAVGHPMAEISDLYYFYVVLGEEDPSVVENFMGFSAETAGEFFRLFTEYYFGTKDPAKTREITEKASVLCRIRMIHKIRKKKTLSEKDRILIDRNVENLRILVQKLDTLAF